MAKKNNTNRQLRSRTTRSSKPRLLTDPTSSTQLLTTQLQSLGLYAAHTIGDGNCLFRALSDQVHGSPEKHRQVRKQICDWIEQHKECYEGFVEDDDYLIDSKAGKSGSSSSRDKGKGLEAHLRCMRENATYGGHMELSAFAHLTKRNIKVIQPGLVYVIEWNAGESSQTSTNSTSTSSSSSKPQDQDSHPEPRRSKRTQRSSLSSSSPPKQSSNPNQEIVKIGTGKHGYYVYEEISDSDDDNDEQQLEESLKQDVEDDQAGEGESDREGGGETVYVAYHDWEHFSSIRNLRGPHAGLPHVRETPAQSVLAQREHEREALKEREREKKRKDKEREREIKKTSVMKVKLKLSSPPGSTATPAPQRIAVSTSLSSLSSCSSLTSIGSINASTTTAVTADPTLIPLPNSRSVSPFPSIPFSPPSATAQLHLNSGTQDSTSTSTTASTSTLTTALPPISIPTISPPIPATPTSPTSTPVSSINTTHSSHPHAHSHLHQHLHQHQHRSPKRTFDESSASGEDGDGGSGGSTGGSGCSGREKRTRVGSAGGRSRLGTGSGGDVDADNMDVDRDTPGLSAPGSSSSSATSPDSSSDLTSPSPPPQQILVEPETVSLPPHAKSPNSKKGTKFSYGVNNTNKGSKPLTRRQRKALGLPKVRPSLPNQPTTSSGAGKIIIPGGKWTGRQTHSTAVSVVDGEGGGDEEWRRNGTGRVDVRGFRELKI